MCANFIYDLNGKKGPNKVGKDIGVITALYPTEPSVVAPMPLTTNAKNGNAKNGNATTMKHEFAAAACEAQDENSGLPNKEELASLLYNGYLVWMTGGMTVWSSSVASVIPSPGYAWEMYFYSALGHLYGSNTSAQV